MSNIYLASSSPRRKELLTQVGIDFIVISPQCDESADIELPDELVEEFSRRKSLAGLEMIKKMPDVPTDSIVIGADTVVAYDGIILGKPKDDINAFNMLKMLSGNTHEVYTGVTLTYLDGRAPVTFSERTEVTFYELTDKEIEDYISTTEPMDKAGSYGIQGYGATLVEKIHGDYFNIVGLPIARLARMLRK